MECLEEFLRESASALDAFLLIVWANGVPVAARLVLGSHLRAALDGGRLFLDGRPWLGPSKTWRGLTASLGTTPLLALALGLPWEAGLMVAMGAMAGDLATSFLKRRLGRAPSESVAVLDQFMEAVLPLLVVKQALGLSGMEMLAVFLGFTLLDGILTPMAARLSRTGGSSGAAPR